MPTSAPVRGFFTYPWDLTDAPVEATLTTMRDSYACNAVALAGSYHSATLLTPRGLRSYVVERPDAAAMFHPDLAAYPPEGPWPVVDTATADADILRRAADACARLGMQFNVWLVVLHSSALGRAHPDLTCHNIMEDAYSFSLCPSQARVRAYAVGLVRDVCHQVQPHTVLLESATFMPALHGGHHDISLLAMNPVLQWLLTLCFCPACVARAEAAGVDVVGAADDTRAMLRGLMNDGTAGVAGVGAEVLGSTLVERPRLAAYSQVRIATVMSLLAEMRVAAAEGGARLEVIPNTGVRPIARSWALGVHLADLRAVADGAMVLGYYAEPREVITELNQYQLLAGDLPFSLALNVGHALSPTRAGLVARAVVGTQAGARGVFYYNWGLLSEERLSWVRAANEAVVAASQP
ncbi:MAG: hypothetical protein KIS91_17810 [Anaerolineae bacterium]|nr:hypothetical protein [Anaerolineae bacterium]